jgi:hypothetical protein
MACRVRYLNSAGIHIREIPGIVALSQALPPQWLFYASLQCYPSRGWVKARHSRMSASCLLHRDKRTLENLEFGAGVVVARFTKPRKSFKPVH